MLIPSIQNDKPKNNFQKEREQTFFDSIFLTQVKDQIEYLSAQPLSNETPVPGHPDLQNSSTVTQLAVLSPHMHEDGTTFLSFSQSGRLAKGHLFHWLLFLSTFPFLSIKQKSREFRKLFYK